MGLVDDEQVPGERVPALEPLRRREEAASTSGWRRKSIDVIDARRHRPGVGVHPVLALDVDRGRAVEDREVERELRAQLVAPLELERRGADHEHAADAPAPEQLAQDEPGLDGLAQADVVGEQQR